MRKYTFVEAYMLDKVQSVLVGSRREAKRELNRLHMSPVIADAALRVAKQSGDSGPISLHNGAYVYVAAWASKGLLFRNWRYTVITVTY